MNGKKNETLGRLRLPASLDYRSDPDVYLTPVRKARSLEALKLAVLDWRDVFPDAYNLSLRMTEAEFAEWLWFVAHSERDYKPGPTRDRVELLATKWGAILLPDLFLMAGVAAQHFGTPWGCALIRCLEVSQT